MKKKLYKSDKQILVSGVLSGFAEYFEHNPLFWRLGFLLLLIITGFMPGIFMYIAAWIIMPTRPRIEPMMRGDYTVLE